MHLSDDARSPMPHRSTGAPLPPAGGRWLARLVWLAAAVGVALPAHAVAPFQFEKPEEVARPTWSGNTQVGIGLAGGNTQMESVTGQANLAWRSAQQRLQGGAELSLARAQIRVAHEEDGQAGVGPGELRSEERTTREAWALRGRYDLFLTRHGSAYFSSSASGDRPAGKELILAIQGGYGADVLHLEHHSLRLELGYDLAREHLVGSRPLAIHSARIFAGYAAKLQERFTATVQAELLSNLNGEPSRTPPVARFKDLRLLASANLVCKLDGTLSAALRLSATYASAPAPLPAPPGTSYEPGYTPLAERLDRTADLLLMASF